MSDIEHKEPTDKFPYVLRVMGRDSSQELHLLGTAILIHYEWVVTSKHVAERLDHLNEAEETRVILQSYDEDINVKIYKIRYHRTLDLAAIKLRQPVHRDIPVFLHQVRKEFDDTLEKLTYQVVGYSKKSNGERDTNTCRSWMRTYTEDSEGVELLKDMQLRGGPSRGNSGGAVLIEQENQIVCIGSMWSGDDGSATSHFISSDRIIAFARESLQLEYNSTQDAGIFFDSFKTQQELPQEREQCLQLEPSATPSENRPIYRRHMAGAFIGLLVLALIAVTLISNRGQSIFGKQTSEGHSSDSVDRMASRLQTDCPSMEELEKRKYFSSRPGLKVLVLRFTDVGKQSDFSFGEVIGQRINDDLRRYVHEEMRSAEWEKAQLSADSVEVSYCGCPAVNHDKARELGKAAGAAVVLWGQATTLGSTSPTENKGFFTPAITIIQYQSFQTEAKAVSLNDVFEVGQMSFTQMMSDESVALFQFMLGVYLHQQRLSVLATEYFKKVDKTASSLYRSSGDAANLLTIVGLSYAATFGMLREALQKFDEAVEKCHPDDDFCKIRTLDYLTMIYHMGLRMVTTEDYSRALTHCKTLLAMAEKLPESEENRRRLGHTYPLAGTAALGLNKYPEAEVYLKKSLELDTLNFTLGGDRVTVIVGLSVALLSQGKYQEAVSWIDTVIRDTRNDGHLALLYRQRARGKSNLGQYLDAVSDNRVAAMFFTKSSQPQPAREALESAFSLAQKNRLNALYLPIISDAHNLDFEDVALALQARYHYHTGDYKLAESAYRQLAALVTAHNFSSKQPDKYALIAQAGLARARQGGNFGRCEGLMVLGGVVLQCPKNRICLKYGDVLIRFGSQCVNGDIKEINEHHLGITVWRDGRIQRIPPYFAVGELTEF